MSKSEIYAHALALQERAVALRDERDRLAKENEALRRELAEKDGENRGFFWKNLAGVRKGERNKLKAENETLRRELAEVRRGSNDGTCFECGRPGKPMVVEEQE